jgi:hypothetical protein
MAKRFTSQMVLVGDYISVMRIQKVPHSVYWSYRYVIMPSEHSFLLGFVAKLDLPDVGSR